MTIRKTLDEAKYRADNCTFCAGFTWARSRAVATGLVISCYSGVAQTGYQVPPKAASVFASTAAHSSARSSPLVSAIDRSVTGTR
jgi:hypothetical protein